MEDTSVVNDYLCAAHAAERLRILQNLRDKQAFLPIPLSTDLLKLKLSPDEHIGILRTTSTRQKLSFEDYITSQLSGWDQNVASAALWEWALRTDCVLWHRTLPLSLASHTPQRIRYTLLDLAWFGGGYPLVAKLAAMDGLEDMSVAFLSLLCFRSLQFGVASTRLLDMAKRGLESSYQAASAAERTLPYFLAYIFRFDQKWAQAQKRNHSFSGIWSQYLYANTEERRWDEEVHALKAALSPKKNKKIEENLILRNWPSIWERHRISADILVPIFQNLQAAKLPTIAQQSWEFFAGIPQKTLMDVLQALDDPRTLILACNVLTSLLDYRSQREVLERIRSILQASDDPSSLLACLAPRYAAQINGGQAQSGVFARITEEREKTLEAFEKAEPIELKGFGLWEKEFSSQDATRHSFFALAYQGKKTNSSRGDDYWSALIEAWNQPSAEKIDPLSLKARQAPHLFQICFIDCLGRFKGSDAAALKLLDFIRSSEEPVVRSVIYALQGIGTVRASQELVAFLTRPNVSTHLQLEITQLLKELDVSHLQAELRSALNDLNYRTMGDSLLIELRDAISSLLVIEDVIKPSESAASSTLAPTTMDLDKLLQQKIDHYDLLSSEVKRALRTAQFFHLQVEQVGSQLGTIDLSPAIDMQYKALELCFREKFEQACSELIRQGLLQRKLDVIGYARPIPAAMDEFESYIESLPIIKTIPFFSRFKLRKMLRAICQYRPGKRFTLDGLKAFAIFFICFSRTECRYGLGNIFPVPTMTSEQMLHFCKELHVFQDFRNRAAHEGFHPDASNNLDSIWKSTALIIQGMFLVARGLEQAPTKPSTIRKII